MAIQFLCSACGQPIEVDDDMANLTVTCPYCRKVVVTPSQTNLTARPGVPAPAIAGFGAAPSSQPFPAAISPPPKRSVLGWVALACSAVSIACIAYAGVVGYLLFRDLQSPDMKVPEVQKVIQQRLEGRRDLQIAGFFGSCGFPVVSLVCAIVALVIGARPRWPAITALCLVGGTIVLLCAGVMGQAMAARAAGS